MHNILKSRSARNTGIQILKYRGVEESIPNLWNWRLTVRNGNEMRRTRSLGNRPEKTEGGREGEKETERDIAESAGARRRRDCVRACARTEGERANALSRRERSFSCRDGSQSRGTRVRARVRILACASDRPVWCATAAVYPRTPECRGRRTHEAVVQ